MALTVTTDAAALGARVKRTKDSDAEEVERVFDLAVERLAEALEDAWRPMPQGTVNECVLRIGQALWDSATKTSAGTGQVAVTDAPAGPRAPRDPLHTSRLFIDQYVVGL